MQSVWMIVAALLFSLMGVGVKLASAHYNTWEIVAYRGLVGMVVMGGVVSLRAHRSGTSFVDAVRTKHLATHARRSIAGTISLVLWFFAIAGLPLSTAMTISSSSPLFIGAWVTWQAARSGLRVDRTMTVALVTGFVGVLVLLQPTLAQDQTGYAIVGIVSTSFTAVAYLSLRALGRLGEPDLRVVFYFSTANALAGLLGASFLGFHALDPRGAALLALVGVTGAVAQLAVTRAFASGGTLLSANLGYTGIIFSTIWGVLCFGDAVQALGLLGMALIVLSSVVATLVTARASRREARFLENLVEAESR